MRRWLVVGAALAVIAAGLWVVLQRRPPSIVLIMVDTLRADFVGAYGFEGAVSPHLDRFAAEAALFTRCYSQAPWTKPAIATLFTSLHPESHNVVTHKGRYGERDDRRRRADALPGAATTLAEVLAGDGYATAAFVANPWITRSQGFAQGFEHFDDRFTGNDTPASAVLRHARAWLAARADRRPLFLYLHFMDVHGPYRAPERDFEAVWPSPGLGEPRPLGPEALRRMRAYLLRVPWRDAPGARDVRTWRGRYAAGVRAFDRQIGNFLEELRAGPLADPVVVVTSDHGEELAEHQGWDHGYSLYDHQLHVPLLIRLPGGRGGGRRIESVVSLVDLMPTMLALAGAPAPAHLQGRDLSPLLTDAGTGGAGEVLASGVKWQPGVRALRTATHKLIVDGQTDATRLFDLRVDPGEQTDLAAREPELTRRLRDRLHAQLATVAAGPSLAAEQVVVPPALEERLRSLGYAE